MKTGHVIDFESSDLDRMAISVAKEAVAVKASGSCVKWFVDGKKVDKLTCQVVFSGPATISEK